MKLCEGRIGEEYIVKEINLPTKITRRLQMLGMTNGVTVRLLTKKRSGAVILRLRGCRYALGGAFARGIAIEGSKNDPSSYTAVFIKNRGGSCSKGR